MTALDEYDIWPLENNIDINLDSLRLLSLDKLSNRYVDGEAVDQRGVFCGRRRQVADLSVKGNPTLSNVVTVMVGIRNPDKDLEQPLWSSDDGQPKCAELWVNELRLSGLQRRRWMGCCGASQRHAWRLGQCECCGQHVRPGWGGLEQRVQERQRETIQGLDANGTIQLGKLLPEKLGVTLPMYVGYSNQTEHPAVRSLVAGCGDDRFGCDWQTKSQKKTTSKPSILDSRARGASTRCEASTSPT